MSIKNPSPQRITNVCPGLHRLVLKPNQGFYLKLDEEFGNAFLNNKIKINSSFFYFSKYKIDANKNHIYSFEQIFSIENDSREVFLGNIEISITDNKYCIISVFCSKSQADMIDVIAIDPDQNNILLKQNQILHVFIPDNKNNINDNIKNSKSVKFQKIVDRKKTNIKLKKKYELDILGVKDGDYLEFVYYITGEAESENFFTEIDFQNSSSIINSVKVHFKNKKQTKSCNTMTRNLVKYNDANFFNIELPDKSILEFSNFVKDINIKLECSLDEFWGTSIQKDSIFQINLQEYKSNEISNMANFKISINSSPTECCFLGKIIFEKCKTQDPTVVIETRTFYTYYISTISSSQRFCSVSNNSALNRHYVQNTFIPEKKIVNHQNIVKFKAKRTSSFPNSVGIASDLALKKVKRNNIWSRVSICEVFEKPKPIIKVYKEENENKVELHVEDVRKLNIYKEIDLKKKQLIYIDDNNIQYLRFKITDGEFYSIIVEDNIYIENISSQIAKFQDFCYQTFSLSIPLIKDESTYIGKITFVNKNGKNNLFLYKETNSKNVNKKYKSESINKPEQVSKSGNFISYDSVKHGSDLIINPESTYIIKHSLPPSKNLNITIQQKQIPANILKSDSFASISKYIDIYSPWYSTITPSSIDDKIIIRSVECQFPFSKQLVEICKKETNKIHIADIIFSASYSIDKTVSTDIGELSSYVNINKKVSLILELEKENSKEIQVRTISSPNDRDRYGVRLDSLIDIELENTYDFPYYISKDEIPSEIEFIELKRSGNKFNFIFKLKESLKKDVCLIFRTKNSIKRVWIYEVEFPKK